MKPSNSVSTYLGIQLLLAGMLAALFIFVPQLPFARAWAFILIWLAVGFILPPFLWPSARRGLSSLLIPGAIILALGLIFLYCGLTGDWRFWLFAWLLIPAATGLGLLLAAAVGGWPATVLWVGLWMAVFSLVFYGLAALMFGSTLTKASGALLVMLLGAALLVRSLKK